ncbi:heavy metal translocating P-type ATPase [Pseudoleptotrichia goodfellowii]|uniref:P-type Zn(2+) transporter n=1 Tax=Pseudoleptotrichia goodfellowii TaxID=157692 RepID=A0A510JFG3_9FUSO|nr:heavy metal translocating P-type ATPase [Pseudoleptotrichia goodfellowii]BBM37141.1 ATPase P [Pseudoleptotrichia goodfellowii]
MSQRIILNVKGLHCANCAAKIEKKLNEMQNVKEARIDLVGEKIFLTAEEKNGSVLVNAVQKIADSIEEGVKIFLPAKHDHDHVHDHSHHHSGEVGKMIKTLIIGGIFYFSASYLNLFSSYMNPDMMSFGKIILFLISYIIIGGHVLTTAFKNILKGQIFDENFLMAVATIGAFAIGEYHEAVAVMFFYQVGELFQSMAVNKSRKSIASLMNIRPDYANLKIRNNITKVSPEEVKINDFIVVKPGEKVPLDGIITEGSSTFNTSALTGESLPVSKNRGEEVLSGSVNKTGLVTIKVTKLFSESTVSKILDLVENANGKKSKTENFITKFARYYTPTVVGIAVLMAIVPPLVLKETTFYEWLYKALVFLVLSCPCALVISIPLGFFGGIGGASRHGILIKGGNYLEALNNVETVVMDKTGTLTKGVFKVTQINPENNITKEELLQYAAYAESFSTHPIAESVIKEYQKNSLQIDKSLIKNYEEISGYGIKTEVNGKTVIAGNIKLMNLENINIENNPQTGTVVYIAVDGKYAGNLLISDEIKEDSQRAIEDMKKVGVKQTVMLTGDSKAIGESIAEKLNIDKAYTELLPSDKVEKIEEIFEERKSNGKILFVGDGINDAPVLARADIGVAMGGVGSDAAIEAADVVIMNDEPSKIVTAIKIAKKTRKIVWQNIALALGVKIITLVLGVMGFATIWAAIFADVGVALLAILNAARVIRMKV